MPQRPVEQAQQTVCDQAAAFFDAMDKDDDGCATMMEFQAYLRELEANGKVPSNKRCSYQAILEIFNECDTSDDNKITIEEIRAYIGGIPPSKLCAKQIKIAFDELDKDGNNALTLDEIKGVMGKCGFDWSEEWESICGEDGVITLDEFTQEAEKLMKQDD